MRYLFGIIAALPEFAPGWLFRLCARPVALLARIAKAIGNRADGRDFDDGYDRVAEAAGRWGGTPDGTEIQPLARPFAGRRYLHEAGPFQRKP